MSDSSRTLFVSKMPSARELGPDVFLLYDRFLEKKSPALRRWILQFPVRYGVASGEELKSLENFPRHMQQISRRAQGLSNRRMSFVVLGGGSVGDFGGFVASVFKRGVGLIHIPSTWLAAIDSSHGGKTALNFRHIKNQIGTFYPAQKIYLVRELLLAQPEVRAHEAFAEIYKVALMQGGDFWRRFSQAHISSEQLWKFLPSAVKAKYQVVKKDPQEISGHRHLLNFGHTMGHVFESLYDLPHGIAVNYGLHFALEWSRERGVMSEKTYRDIFAAPASGFLLSPAADGFLKLSHSQKMRRLLLNDKKKTSAKHIRFIFCQRPGKLIIHEISIDELVREIIRQSKGSSKGRPT